MNKETLKFFAYILLVCILAVALFFGAAVVSKVVRSAETPPLVKDQEYSYNIWNLIKQ